MTLKKDCPGQIPQYKTVLILSSLIVPMNRQLRDSIRVQTPCIPVDEVMHHQNYLTSCLSIRPVTPWQKVNQGLVEEYTPKKSTLRLVIKWSWPSWRIGFGVNTFSANSTTMFNDSSNPLLLKMFDSFHIELILCCCFLPALVPRRGKLVLYHTIQSICHGIMAKYTLIAEVQARQNDSLHSGALGYCTTLLVSRRWSNIASVILF